MTAEGSEDEQTGCCCGIRQAIERWLANYREVSLMTFLSGRLLCLPERFMVCRESLAGPRGFQKFSVGGGF